MKNAKFPFWNCKEESIYKWDWTEGPCLLEIDLLSTSLLFTRKLWDVYNLSCEPHTQMFKCVTSVFSLVKEKLKSSSTTIICN